MNWKSALHALKNLCTFVGAIVLFSYFANWAVDLRHWYVTLASAVMCSKPGRSPWRTTPRS